MRLCGDNEINGTSAPLRCHVQPSQLCRGQCRGFRGVRLWSDGSQGMNLVIAYPTGLPVEPLFLISNSELSLDQFWSYAQRFCCEQLFRDQKSGGVPGVESGLQDPQRRLDLLLPLVAIAILACSLQGYASGRSISNGSVA